MILLLLEVLHEETSSRVLWNTWLPIDPIIQLTFRPINYANMPAILTAAGTVLPPVPTRTWADTPTTPNLNLPLAPYCHRTVNLTMIAPISLRPTDQPIDQTKCLTDCHHLPLAPYYQELIRLRADMPVEIRPELTRSRADMPTGQTRLGRALLPRFPWPDRA